MNTPTTRRTLTHAQKLQALELNMTDEQYAESLATVESKYGTPTLASSDGLDPLTAHEKSEARELGLTESDYLESKLLVAKKYGAGANHND